MSEEQEKKQRDEKQEKQEEKEEKSWDEKWRRDPLSAAVWAIILIWAGLVLLAGNIGLIGWLPIEPWALLFLGAGIILLLEAGIRLLMPSYRQPVIGTAILGIVFLGIGLGSFVSWQCILPLAVIAVGLYLLFSALFRRR